MTGKHIPAWQRIVIKQQEGKSEGNDFVGEDPLNVTTHLATGSLSKNEKRRIIKGHGQEPTKKVTKKKLNANKKKEKLKKDEREEKRRNTLLKDQLRYLIEFHLHKVSDDLPESLLSLKNVQNNYTKEKLDERKKNDTIVEMWKFSKQKQNWVIKHFFSIEEIPVEYDDILLSYLTDLKSEFLRSTLISKCWDTINDWNKFVERQELEIKNIVDGTAEQAGKNGDEVQDGNHAKTEEDQKDENKIEKDITTTVDNEQSEAPPNKDTVARSVKLLKLWNEHEKSGKPIELRNF